MQIKYLGLWEYQVDYEGHDCDGSHHSSKTFMAVERPKEVVYNEAELFGEDGPSTVTLVDGSTEDSGTAYVGTATDEGGRRYDISWSRVTDSGKLAEFLDDFEEVGPRISNGLFDYLDLYKARIRAVIKEKFPAAITLYARPSSRRGELWTVVQVIGLDDRNVPVTIWEGDTSPFSKEEMQQLSHDMEQYSETESSSPVIAYRV